MYDHGKLHVHCECAEVGADPQCKLCHAPQEIYCGNKMCHLLSKIINLPCLTTIPASSIVQIMKL